MNARHLARGAAACMIGVCVALSAAAGCAEADADANARTADGEAAANAPASHAEPLIAPEAERVLRAAAEHLRRLDSFRVTLTEHTTEESDGLHERTVIEYEMSMRRPNQFAQVARQGTEYGQSIVCDGRKVYVHYPFLYSYTVEDLPAELGGRAEGILDDLGDAVWLRAAQVLLSDHPYEAFLHGMRRVEYLGVEQIDGADHHRLRLHVPQTWLLEVEAEVEVPWDLWLAADGLPLPRRAVPDMNAALDQMRRDHGAERVERMFGADARIEVEYRYADWEPNVEFDADHFTFTPPEGTHEIPVPFLRDLFLEPTGG